MKRDPSHQNPHAATLEIASKKAAYEAFTRSVMSSSYLRKLESNNRTHRHLFRFFLNIFIFSTLIATFRYAVHLHISLALLYPAYLYFQGLTIAGFMIHAHELSHNHIKNKPLNDFLGNLSGYFSFVNFYSFQHAHKFHHKNIGNIDSPEAGAPVSLRGQAKLRFDDKLYKAMVRLYAVSKHLLFVVSWPAFVIFGDYSSWLLPFRHKSGKIDRRSLVSFALFCALNVVAILSFARDYLLLFLPAVIIGGNRVLAITQMHHAHEDAIFFNEENHNYFNTIMSTTDRDFGPIVNFFMLNNGYHIPHHINPKIAYYDLEKASEYLRSTIPAHLSYNYYPDSHFSRALLENFYERRLDSNPEFYQIKFDAPVKFP